MRAIANTPGFVLAPVRLASLTTGSTRERDGTSDLRAGTVTLLLMRRMIRYLWAPAAVVGLGVIGWGAWVIWHAPNRTDLSTYWAFVVGTVAAIAAVIAVIPIRRARPGKGTDQSVGEQMAPPPAGTMGSGCRPPPNVQISGNTFHGPSPIQGSGTQHNRFGS